MDGRGHFGSLQDGLDGEGFADAGHAVYDGDRVTVDAVGWRAVTCPVPQNTRVRDRRTGRQPAADVHEYSNSDGLGVLIPVVSPFRIGQPADRLAAELEYVIVRRGVVRPAPSATHGAG
ncbi:hypothetical protein ACIRG5_45775 [Lentzea sp. NPDC102401]|uniref:hypothetical protein n=1 Tax=Lentzea sp. NPDC102401 TaxID=3364128 RepID=UPI00381506B3